MGQPVRVSVVVPVYNPGEHIEPLIASLRRQSMPAEQFEAIFVDDGCTDQTPARLDALAAEAPNVRVVHQPNSGWPGKPRNVGIDLAQGQFIQFVDQDDELAPQALDRLYRRAIETDSDVVLGKVVGRGRSVPVSVYRTREDHATLAHSPLISTLSPHKLFRTQMLHDHRIRFPEGKRRLEDHPFVLTCYFTARNIAILADYPCYYFTKREDKANSSFQPFDPAGYFHNVEDSIDIVEAHTEPGPLRNRLLSRFYRNEILTRLREPVILELPDHFRKDLFEQARLLSKRRFPDTIPDHLPLPNRLRSILLREGRLDDLIEYARRCSNVHARAYVRNLRVDDGQLQLELVARMGYGTEDDLCWTPAGDRLRLDARLVDGLFDQRAELDHDQVLRQVSFDLTLRNRKTLVEWRIPTSVSLRLTPVSTDPGSTALTTEVTATATIDPARLHGGEPLPAGLWDFRVHLTYGGLARTARLAGPPQQGPLPGPITVDRTQNRAEPYLTRGYGNLSLDVRRSRRPPRPSTRRRRFVTALTRRLRRYRRMLRRIAFRTRAVRRRA